MKKDVRRVDTTTAALPQLMRVCAYTRVSSPKDAMLHSLSAQVSYYNELIQNHPGWVFCGIYSDEGITGTKANRPGFMTMIEDCRSEKIDLIITKSISRFARNTVTLLETVRELKAIGVDVFFEEQNIHTMSAEGELILTILASYAQEESLSASENQKWRVRQNFLNGIPWRGFMLGYRMQGDKYVIVPEEAETVRYIFQAYLAGDGIDKIMKALNGSGILTQQGNEFIKCAIARILRNRTYTGNLLLQTKFRENHLTKKTVINRGELPMYRADCTHEAIIDQTTFDAVQTEIERRAKKYAKVHTRFNYPYTGRIICAVCGKNYRRKVTRTGVVWICQTYNTYGKSACMSKAVPESVLDGIAKQYAAHGKIESITAANGNRLFLTFETGWTTVHCRSDRSRSESWTPEMRIEARANGSKKGKNS